MTLFNLFWSMVDLRYVFILRKALKHRSLVAFEQGSTRINFISLVKYFHIFRLSSIFFRKSRAKVQIFQVKVHFFQKMTHKRRHFLG